MVVLTDDKRFPMVLMEDAMTERERTEPRDLMTLPEIVKRTGMARASVYQKAQRDELPWPVLRAGTRIYVSRAAYQRWLDSGQAQEPEQATA